MGAAAPPNAGIRCGGCAAAAAQLRTRHSALFRFVLSFPVVS